MVDRSALELDSDGDPVKHRTRSQGSAVPALDTATQSFFSRLPEPICLLSRGRIVLTNPALASLCGVTVPDYLAGKTVAQFLSGVDRRKSNSRLKELYRKGEEAGRQAHILSRRDGEELFVELRAFRIQIKGRRLVQLSFKDVTEQRTLEEELQQLQRFESWGHLVGGVAHDLGNMLTPIMAYAQIALAYLGPDSPATGPLENVRKAAERASDLTRQLLAVARGEAVSLMVADLNELLLKSHGILRSLIGEDVELVTNLSERPATVSADAAQLEQVIMNLIVNAGDALPLGGKVIIRVNPGVSAVPSTRELCPKRVDPS